MIRLLVATRSRPKFLEIEALLAPVDWLDLCWPQDLGLAEVPEEETIEAFETFEENALAKARWFHTRTGLPSVADDSGLQVDALEGRPGVHSKRFAPASFERPGDSRDDANIRYLLRKLEGRPDADRGARFVCVAALVGLDAEPLVHRGEVSGHILTRERGAGGFGYDPIFVDSDLQRTFAELSRQEKAARSHRGRAFRALREALQDRGAPRSHG